MNRPRHLRLVSSQEPPPAQQQPRQMVLVYAGLDADARGAETEPIVTANEIVAAQLEAIAQSLRASIPHSDDRRAG